MGSSLRRNTKVVRMEGGQDAWVGRTVGSSLRSTGEREDGGLRGWIC